MGAFNGLQPQFIEPVVFGIIDYFIANQQALIYQVQNEFFPMDQANGYNVNIEPIDLTNIFISEKFMGYQAPALYILNQRGDYDLEATNQINSTHEIIMAVLVEGAASDTLIQKLWRYQLILYRMFHDKSFNTAAIAGKQQMFHLQALSYDMGILLQKLKEHPDQQVFRHDIYIHFKVMLMEGQ